VPKSNRSYRPWAGLADLLAYLLVSGRLGEACFLQMRSSYLRIYSFEAIVRLYREILSHLPAISEDANVRQKLVLMNLQLRTGLLESLVEYETLDHVQSDISDIEKELDTLESSFGLGPDSVKRTCFYLRLCLARIQLIPKTNFQDIYSQNMLLLRNHDTDRHREITTCYQGAALAAKALYQETGNEAWRRRLKDLFEMKEELEFQVFGNILSPLLVHWESIPSSDLNFMTMSHEEVQDIAEWYEDYERDYPGFAIPSIAHQATRLKFRLYVSLGDFREVILARSKLQEWQEKLPLTSDAEVSCHYIPFSIYNGFILSNRN
jgi:hypothetical protein